MKYIPVHVGDWVKHTVSLSIAEEGVYWRACVWCYMHEKPLPLAVKDVAKELRVFGSTNVQTLRGVLDRFFELTEHGWINHRVDSVIANTKQRNGSVTSSVTNSVSGQRPVTIAVTGRQARYRAKRTAIFRVLEQAGVSAPFDSTMVHLDALLRTHGLTYTVTLPPSPDTSHNASYNGSRHVYVNSKPVKQDVTLSRYGPGDRAPDPVGPVADPEKSAQTAAPSALQQPTETVTPTPAAAAAKAMKAAGMQAVNPSHPDLVRLVAAGVTTEELRFAAAEAVARGKPFGYALAMAEGRRRDAAAKADIPPAKNALKRWGPTGL